jgi:hypothetical protein
VINVFFEGLAIDQYVIEENDRTAAKKGLQGCVHRALECA